MNTNIEKWLLELHRLSGESAKILVTDHSIELYGCFHCGQIFHRSEVDLPPYFEDENYAAQCPYCAMDTVLPQAEGVAVTPELLKEIQEVFFSQETPPHSYKGYNPFPFLDDREHLKRRDTRKLMNIIARAGCKVCVQRKDCLIAAGEMLEADYLCCFEVDTAMLARVIHKGI